ncbi:MAG TPA: cyclic nucleotide-binding domain-containing protein, partial [Actinomycetota bacterium]|nr:cyclic nucleotide-binding domain-containing protein [Actinomycetota bacterium]
LVEVPAGTVLTREGSPGREAFVIAEGRASVTLDGRAMAELGPGAFFGEMALLDRGPRSATVEALTPMTLFVLDARSFSSLLAETPSVVRKMLQTVAVRLRAYESAAM